MFVGSVEEGEFHTAYPDRQLERKYGEDHGRANSKSLATRTSGGSIHRVFPGNRTLYVDRGKPFGEGETIAKNLVVFFDQDNENEVIGIMIEHAETVLKPFVDAILAKHGVSRGPT